ncbi:MAG: sugar ABC transporter permease [Clostridiales bacterium]|jgi:ABC-type sugar transport system permease subunit|nr:sugar ABC transporter permease [Clostridiales bacterium]
MVKTQKRAVKETLTAFAWLILPAGLMLIFCLYPAAAAILRSFMDYAPSGSRWIWFGNFSALFNDAVFRKSLLNMLILVSGGLLTGNVATLFLAECLFNMRNRKASKAFRYLFLIPSLVPGMVTALLWKNVILSGDADGLMNRLTGLFGAPPNAWYFSERLSKASIVLTNFPWVGGISFLIYLAGLQSIRESCLEAAELDGVTVWKRVWHIDLPLLLGQIKYFLIIGIVGGVQVFDMQLIITDGGPNYSTTVPGYLLYLKTYGYSAVGEASAIGVLLFAVTFTAMTIANKVLARAQKDAA